MKLEEGAREPLPTTPNASQDPKRQTAFHAFLAKQTFCKSGGRGSQPDALC